MKFLIATLARSLFGPQPDILCATEVWRAGVAELRQRAGGRRESGAFLLGAKKKVRRIVEFVYYDDIDPNALSTGIVRINGRKLGALWEHCRRTGRSVVADIHVHPGNFRQSQLDKENPVIPEVGHIAIVLPRYATGTIVPSDIGINEYLGSRKWKDLNSNHSPALHIGWWPWS